MIPTDATPLSLSALLHAIVYGDSAFPSGRYTLSHGLEGFVQAGYVTGVESVAQALEEHLRYAAAPGDGVATATVVSLLEANNWDNVEANNWDGEEASTVLGTLCRLDEELAATKVTKELRVASTRVGRQTLEVYMRSTEGASAHNAHSAHIIQDFYQLIRSKKTPGNQAIALGLIHSRQGLTPAQATAVELIGLAVGWSSAALRLRQCDHIDAQKMLHRVSPLIDTLSQECAEWAEDILHGRDTLGRSSPGLDVVSAQHEYAPARLFMS